MGSRKVERLSVPGFRGGRLLGLVFSCFCFGGS